MNAWRARRERGSDWLIRLIAYLARRAGRPLCRALLYPITLYFLLADATARRASREFLSLALGRPAGWRDAFAHLHCFAATLLDRVYMAAGEFQRFALTVEGEDLLHEALAQGKGCVLLGSHLGSFDLLMLANRSLHRNPVSALMRVHSQARLRQIAGIEDDPQAVIALGRPDSMLRAFEALEQGRILAALADRADGAAHLPSAFFGRPAAFPLAPHVLAARSGAPVLLCFGLYEGGAAYRILFTPFGPGAPQASKGAALQEVVDRYCARLEQAARRYPMNWFNFYPYWEAQ